MEGLTQLYSQQVHSSASCLLVSEDLWLICVLNGAHLDFYDLALLQAEPSVHSIKLLGSTHVGDAAAVEAALCPHEPSLLAVGTAAGAVALFRLRRAGGSSASGALLVHKTLERQLAPAGTASSRCGVDAIRFHPHQRGLAAVACAGQVHLLQHDFGLLASCRCCGESRGAAEAASSSASLVRSLAWCGSMLACGDESGTITVWRVSARPVDPRTPAAELAATSEATLVLPPPPSSAVMAVSTLKWLPLAAEASSAATPAGVLACGFTTASADAAAALSSASSESGGRPPPVAAVLRAWQLTVGGDAKMLASLPAAPLRGASALVLAEPSPPGAVSASSSPPPPPKASAASSAASTHRRPLLSAAFEASADPRWLLCGARGSSAVFALPWGRAGESPDADAQFPLPADLLRTPSLALTPAPPAGPAGGVRGIHRLSSSAVKARMESALEMGGEGAGGAGELSIVLSAAALHVVAHVPPTPLAPPLPIAAASHAVTSETEGAEAETEAGPFDLNAPSSPEAEVASPLVAHLLPTAMPLAKVAAASKESNVGKVGKAPPAAASSSKKPSTESTAALHARIAALEQRAVAAEAKAAELQTSFALFAAQSRSQTTTLLAALETLTARQASGNAS